MSVDPSEDRNAVRTGARGRGAAKDMSALPEYHDTVRQEWIDYNGHMSEAFYVLVFGFATDQVMDTLGMGESYRRRTGNSLYTVEAHVRYLDQTRLGESLSVTTTLVAAREKKLHLAHEMRVGERLVATEELLGIHVGADQAVPFGADVSAEIDRYLRSHELHPPDWTGRVVHC